MEVNCFLTNVRTQFTGHKKVFPTTDAITGHICKNMHKKNIPLYKKKSTQMDLRPNVKITCKNYRKHKTLCNPASCKDLKLKKGMNHQREKLKNRMSLKYKMSVF